MIDTVEKYLKAAFWHEKLTKIIDWGITAFPKLLILAILLFVSLKLLRLLMKRMRKFTLRRANNRLDGEQFSEVEKRINTILGIVEGIGKIAIWSIVSIIFLKIMGVNVGPILAGAGILGLAVGFGSQELVRDFISGFFIILENQVRTGDVAIINGKGGLVEKIELRTITLRDFSGVVHIFQNGKIDSLSNMTKEWSAMVFDIGVAYKENTDIVMEVMREVGDAMQKDDVWKAKIIEPIEIMGVDQFADSAVVIRARFKTKPIEQWNVGREYRNRLKKAFDARNIEIPFPHTTVYWGTKLDPLKLEIEKDF